MLFTYLHMISTGIKKLDHFLGGGIKSGIITDIFGATVTDLFSFEFNKEDQNLEKNVTFMEYMHELSFISIQKKLPIIVTNMIRQIDDLEKENLAKPISMFTHIKIKLLKKETKYFGEIFPSFLQKKEFVYQITKEGLVDSS